MARGTTSKAFEEAKITVEVPDGLKEATVDKEAETANKETATEAPSNETETANKEAVTETPSDENETYKAKKDTDKFKSIMDVTIRNFSNMKRRLTHKKDFANNILIYYSIALIVYSLTAKFFPNFYGENMSSYFSIILSVIILAYSIINSNADYGSRLEKIDEALNEVKTIKRDLKNENIKEMKERYDKVMNVAEYREDVDFFLTIRQLCKETNRSWLFYRHFKDREEENEVIEEEETKIIVRIKTKKKEKKKDNGEKLKNYLCELNYPFFVWCSIAATGLIRLILVLMPLILFGLCVGFRGILG